MTFEASTGVSVSARKMAPPIANAYVDAMGEKMTPATPVMVKSGRKATPMISVEKVIGPATSLAPLLDALDHRPAAVSAEVTEDVLHHDDGGVDDDAEVDGAERDQVGGGMAADQAGEGAEQCERDVDGRHDRRAQVTEEEEEHDRDQRHPHEQVLEHRVRRELHQFAAVVVRDDVHAGRQDVVSADVVDAPVDAAEGRRRLAAVAHQHDALHDVGVVVVPDDPQAWRGANRDIGDVANPDGDAVGLVDDYVLDVVHVADEPDAAHRVRLLADLDALSADVLVAGLQRADHLRQRRTLTAQAVGVDVDVVLLGLSAEACDVDDARHLLELPLEDPVLDRLQLASRIALADDVVAEQLPDGVPGRQRALQVVRQRHHAETVEDLLPRVLVDRVPSEVALHVDSG